MIARKSFITLGPVCRFELSVLLPVAVGWSAVIVVSPGHTHLPSLRLTHVHVLGMIFKHE